MTTEDRADVTAMNFFVLPTVCDSPQEALLLIPLLRGLTQTNEMTCTRELTIRKYSRQKHSPLVSKYLISMDITMATPCKAMDCVH